MSGAAALGGDIGSPSNDAGKGGNGAAGGTLTGSAGGDQYNGGGGGGGAGRIRINANGSPALSGTVSPALPSSAASSGALSVAPLP